MCPAPPVAYWRSRTASCAVCSVNYSYSTYVPAFNLTNNLALRSKLAFFQYGALGFLPLTVNLYNNTFSGGQVNLAYNDSSTIGTVRDNLFDNLVLGQGSLSFTHDHNAYSGTTGLAQPPHISTDVSSKLIVRTSVEETSLFKQILNSEDRRCNSSGHRLEFPLACST